MKLISRDSQGKSAVWVMPVSDVKIARETVANVIYAETGKEAMVVLALITSAANDA